MKKQEARNGRIILIIAVLLCLNGSLMADVLALRASDVLVETESFDDKGGWTADSQFIDLMGSTYLMAHGLGRPVENAKTSVSFSERGKYHIWVRTKDWIPEKEWAPGKFSILIDGKTLGTEFGTVGDGKWVWQSGGSIEITTLKVQLELKDLTGFNGRCDAIFFSKDPTSMPPNGTDKEAREWRNALLGLPTEAPSGGQFDVIVVGGGISGCSAALTAARLGCRVAMIQNRKVFGGNSSTEIGVKGFRWGLPSDVITREVWDRVNFNELVCRRKEAMTNQENLTCFMGWHVLDATTENGKITSVLAINTETNKEKRFKASLWIDCSGDGWLGYHAGAHFRYGRESRSEHGEPLAPVRSDNFVLGSTLHWRAGPIDDQPKTFPPVPWALAVAKDKVATKGGWTWEYGHNRDMIYEAEEIRDYLFRSIFGAFSNAKTTDPKKYEFFSLNHVAYVLGKRESRRLLGDYIMTAMDCWETPRKHDKVGNSNNPFDVHKPTKKHDFNISVDEHYGGLGKRKDADIPFRSLYSRNIPNLLMAGRCISVTHLAHSSTRVMNTGSQTGIAAGAGAYLSFQHNTSPREVGKHHLAELQNIVFNRGDYKGALERK